MTNIYELANSFGKLDPYKSERNYKHRTVDEMVLNTTNRIDETILAMSNFVADELDEENNPVRLHSPMAWQHRKGYAVKIGYGSKNEALFNFGTKEVYKRDGTVVERAQTVRYFKSKDDAIDFLTAIRNETEGLAELCEAWLVSIRKRQVKAAAATKKKEAPKLKAA